MKRFWKWYKSNYQLNLTVTVLLFSLQIIHLFWLLTHIVLPKLGFGDWFYHFSFLNWPLILVDYTEIPAIIATSLIYINEIRKGDKSFKPWIYLLLLNVQWIHLFWITDEFVVDTFHFSGILWWLAIAIDYLEIPVIIDTIKKLIASFKKRQFDLIYKILKDR